MKICILSMQHVQNFGSLLQSYALKNMIESLGHKVSFIDIKKNNEDYELLEGNLLNINCNKKIDNNTFSKFSKFDKYVINRVIIKRKANEQDLQFNTFRNKVLGVSQKDNIDYYDYCVIGSDEVFNCLTKSKWGFTSQLFGNVEQAKNVITYAASCGATTYEKIPEPVKNKISETFNSVKAISVRDGNTYNFVNKLASGKEVSINLDPVVVKDFSEELKEIDISNKVPNKYCIVYSYYNRINKKEEINAIKRFCKKNNLKLITVGAPQMWIKNHVVLTPFEVLKAFKCADFIITDTFHGTIFSAKYSKKFATFTRSSNYNKLSDLVNRLQIQDHLMTSLNDLDRIYEIEHNKLIIDSIEKEQYKKTISYLSKNLISEK
ncbi:polysaccharide pyruvyl transferase family protein [Clostridium perfringens]|uniref:polysaccharide pyruvyl transferase family protein n=1 Tax=Clostridium perfringens TaxID=1502 RepID=UPI0013E2CF35|nr:polysaccharide pyruvyl transferase family protein [Clostridium perfringens]ELC8330624.1 polysaccharide pyruvyl transferase family protein [Clostridium perfringens]MDK0554234.1 polysaccharide pyruvyl transferase family protein [Clostridium perfringens]NGT02819.1 polysaccharide pyruvyl transferase family protein [Clostridium perfringens]